MDPDFWHERWQKNLIGFHEGEANTLLVAHFAALHLAKGSRVFVPLCGKTRDIAWLLSQGLRVAGAELSRMAVEQLFDELAVQADITTVGKMERFSAPGIDIFVGDIFDLTAEMLGPLDASYDRAALVALPAEMRGRYASHLAEITARAPQLLICFAYDQSQMNGPPFSVDAAEVARVYGDQYKLAQLAEAPASRSFPGKTPAQEVVWLLQ